MNRAVRRIAACALLLACPRVQADCAESISSDPGAFPWRRAPSLCENLHYGDKGLEWVSPRAETSFWVGLRFQTRVDTFSGDLATVEDLIGGGGNVFDLRRARLKGAWLFRDWLEVYSEYDWRSDTLLDYRATATYDDRLGLRVGQWKSDYNRERVDSSGKQQLVERSLSNFWFTIDRQKGIVASARLAEGSRLDTKAWGGFLSGQGRGGRFFEEDSGLALGRWQWNPAGEVLPFSQSDLERRASPVPSIAVATVFGRTPFTRFSGSGGGDLPGFDRGDFDLRQFLFETAWHYRGIAWQQELHWKDLKDRETGETTRLIGGYAQIGSFLNEWWPSVPSQLELLARVSLVDPDRSLRGNTEREWTLGANWFIDGHRNKFTADVSWLNFDSPARDASQTRFRIQWELSI